MVCLREEIGESDEMGEEVDEEFSESTSTGEWAMPLPLFLVLFRGCMMRREESRRKKRREGI